MTVVGEATLELRGNSASLEAALRSAQRTFNRVGQSLQATGRTLNRRLTLPLVGIGTASVTVAARFEESMSRIEGLVGIAADQVDQWGQDILKLAPQLGRSPQELAEGLFFVTSAGFRGAEAMEVLKISAQAAAAGLGETKTIADAVTSVVNAYGSDVVDAAKATDILTAAVREGKLEAETIAPVLGNLVSTAASMGIGFEQVAGLMAVFSRTGADAASSAVTLNRLILTLSKNTGPAVDLLESQNLSLAKLREIARGPEGLIGVMRLLDETFGDNEEALTMLFPNIRAFRGVANALAQDASVVDSIMSGVANSTGDASKAFGVASSTGAFKLRQAFAQLKVTGIEIGNVILPVVADIARQLADALGRLSPEAIRTGVSFAAIAAAAGPALIVLGSTIRVMSGVAGAAAFMGRQLSNVVTILRTIVVTGAVRSFSLLATVLRSVGTAAAWVGGLFAPVIRLIGGFVLGPIIRGWSLLAGAFATVAGKLGFLFKVFRPVLSLFRGLSLLFNPVILGLAAVAAAITLMANRWDDLPEIAARAWSTTLDVAGRALSAIANVARGTINFIIGLLRFVGEVAVIIWDEFVKEPFLAAFRAIKDFAEPILAGIAAGLEFIGGAAAGAAEAIKGFFADAAEGGEEEGATIGSRVAAAAVESFGADYVGAFVEVVQEGVRKAAARVRELLPSGGGGAGPGEGPGGLQLDPLIAGGQAGFGGVSLLATGTAGAIDTATESVSTFRNTAVNATDEAMRGFDDVGSAVNRMANGLTDSVASALTGAKGAFKNFVDFAIRELARLAAKFVVFNAIKALLGGPAAVPGSLASGFGGVSFFAEGGFLLPGELGIVGEAGPELVTGGPAGMTVTPLTAGAGSSVMRIDLSGAPRPLTPGEAARNAELMRLFARQVEEHLNSGRSFDKG